MSGLKAQGFSAVFLLVTCLRTLIYWLMSITLWIWILLSFGPPNKNTLKKEVCPRSCVILGEIFADLIAVAIHCIYCHRIRMQLPGERYMDLGPDLDDKFADYSHCHNNYIFIFPISGTFSHEFKLFRKLFRGYDTTVRPRFNSMDTVTVSVRFSLQQIYDLVGNLLHLTCLRGRPLIIWGGVVQKEKKIVQRVA